MNITLNQDNFVSILNNPFKSDLVSHIFINGWFNFSGEFVWYGSVKFKNGNTIGEQKFDDYKHDEFNKLVTEIESFIKSLE